MGGFLVASIPSTGSGTKAAKKQAFQGSAIASFLRFRFGTGFASPYNPCHGKTRIYGYIKSFL
ncbi:MAG: hypothetical protein ACI4MA_04565 [Treponema sp.]